MLIQLIMRRTQEKNQVTLYDAIKHLRSTDEIQRFFLDLCTPGEIKDLSERWTIAKLLNKGDLSYRAIADKTGASTTTVGRVARFLFQERHQGYRQALDRLFPPRRRKKISDEFTKTISKSRRNK